MPLHAVTDLSTFFNMNLVLQDQVAGHRLGVQNVCSMISKQGKLTHEQHLKLKRGGRPCPELNIKNVTSKKNQRGTHGYAEIKQRIHFIVGLAWSWETCQK